MFHKIAIAVLLSVFSLLSHAQAWPSKPIRLIVNFPAGSAPDSAARIVVPLLSNALGQPVMVENRPGAGGTIGVDYVVKAAPDGYTLLSGSAATMAVNPHLYKNERAKELIPLGALTMGATPLVVRPGLPIQTVKDLIAYGRANPGKLNYGSSGIGSSMHIGVETFIRAAGFTAVHIPYPGSAQTVNALLAGNVDFAFDPGTAAPHVKAGKLKYIAVQDRRSELFPGVPTVLEEAGFSVSSFVPGQFFAPPGTPPEIVNRLHLELRNIWQSEKFRAALIGGSQELLPEFLSSQDLVTALRVATERLGITIRAIGIKAE